MNEKNKLGSSGIGGQAVMEGIMMRNKEDYAVAVRKSDGSIEVDVQKYKGITSGKKILSLPFIRGIFNFIDSMILGIKTLTFSANLFEENEEEEPDKFEEWLLNKFGDRAEKIIMGFTVALSVVIAVALFMILPLFISTTGVASDGTEFVKSWVLNWDKVAQAKWFALPKLMPVKPVFDLRAILPVLIMFIVTAVETVGDISGVMEGGMSREATDQELSGGVICDGIGSSIAALFGVLPNTSFSQNVGLVTMTKIVNRFALACGAIFLIICGLFPKLAALVSIMPQSVLGGAAVIMFSSIVMSGIQLITKEPLTARSMTIVSVALGLGYGIGANSAILVQLPQAIQMICGESGIVPAAFVAIILNILLPKEKQ